MVGKGPGGVEAGEVGGGDGVEADGAVGEAGCADGVPGVEVSVGVECGGGGDGCAAAGFGAPELVEHEVTGGVDDELTLVGFSVLDPVGVVTDDHFGAVVDDFAINVGAEFVGAGFVFGAHVWHDDGGHDGAVGFDGLEGSFGGDAVDTMDAAEANGYVVGIFGAVVISDAEW